MDDKNICQMKIIFSFGRKLDGPFQVVGRYSTQP
jgi:hypothetical protein